MAALATGSPSCRKCWCIIFPMSENATIALPEYLTTLLAQQYAPDDVERICTGLAAQRVVSLRANTLLATRDEVSVALADAGLPAEPVAWYDDAFALPHGCERTLWDLPLYQEGKIYLQSLSSMIPPLVLGAPAGEDVLDMCAAPGGKTTQIVALSGGKAHVTACEMHAPRAEKLEYNLRKLGCTNVVVMRTDARQLDSFFSFDRILLDAPCSGSGTLSTSNDRHLARFTPALVNKSRKAQKALFAKALELLKPGGTLVYSTCSVLACENEDVVETALAHAPRGRSFRIASIALPRAGEPTNEPSDEPSGELPCLPTRLEGALCLAPTERYEGFFVAKIKRTA